MDCVVLYGTLSVTLSQSLFHEMCYRGLFKYIEFLEGAFRPLEAFQQKIDSETLKERGKSVI